MAVIRAQHTGDFTILDNGPLRDPALSLKAKGLLWLLVSLPAGWDYSVRGLAAVCREGVEAVSRALGELERAGYVRRRQVRGPDGRIRDTEYLIWEKPEAAAPGAGKPEAAKSPQSRKEKQRTKQARKEQARTHPIPSGPEADGAAEGDADQEPDWETVRAQILENIEYDQLLADDPTRAEELDELVELAAEAVCDRRPTARIAGCDLPRQAVRERFLKLGREHMVYVLDSLARCTVPVRNAKQYLLSALFNAPATMANAYAVRVARDLGPPEP
ncbi:DUF6017 domain-containing protein [uncultured Oscillibacter sp.]|uniref:DUF6017 domain-containing protein n=1 Tax=uncultured Oscillibacter sp. TaxID=876091 RepID=UPI0025EDDFF3|nr:DUF6017 domain-containing protein [uncultured Oscillibacter sp.]